MKGAKRHIFILLLSLAAALLQFAAVLTLPAGDGPGGGMASPYVAAASAVLIGMAAFLLLQVLAGIWGWIRKRYLNQKR